MLAVVVTNQQETDRLEKLENEKVCFICCPVRRTVMVDRCHRCNRYDHNRCKTENIASVCFKYEEAYHRLAEYVRRAQAACYPRKGSAGRGKLTTSLDLKHIESSRQP